MALVLSAEMAATADVPCVLEWERCGKRSLAADEIHLDIDQSSVFQTFAHGV